jgi:hypothetical protein
MHCEQRGIWNYDADAAALRARIRIVAFSSSLEA